MRLSPLSDGDLRAPSLQLAASHKTDPGNHDTAIRCHM